MEQARDVGQVSIGETCVGWAISKCLDLNVFVDAESNQKRPLNNLAVATASSLE